MNIFELLKPYEYIHSTYNTEYPFNFVISGLNIKPFKKNLIIVNATAKYCIAHEYTTSNIYVVHSKKLLGLFKSSQTANQELKLCGYIDGTYCFMPYIGHKTPGLHHTFGRMQIKELKQLINTSCCTLNGLLNDLIFGSAVSVIQRAANNLLAYEIAVRRYLITSAFKTKIPMQIYSNIPLPFQPNTFQKQVYANICQQLSCTTVSSHLIYGDVGSGKTLLAYMAAVQCYLNNRNCAILVPNVVLANQVAENFRNWNTHMHVVTVTGHTARQHNQIDINKPTVFVGTHALLYRQLPELALVIIDEQQKFGVMQRAALLSDSTELIMLTATPIPRTLQLALTGAITYSVLNSDKVKNKIIVVDLKHIHQIIQDIVQQCQYTKVIWIETTIEDAEERYIQFKTACCSTELVHGQIADRAERIKQFINGTSGIIVGTTVLEVGLDSDVNIIVIANADHLGISQLHQLNGRVGRRGVPGVVTLIGRDIKKLTEFATKETGIEVAQFDLKRRGGSNMLQLQQSGFNSFIFSYKLVKNQSHKNISWQYYTEISNAVIELSYKLILNTHVIDFMRSGITHTNN
jgi:RecG-like helicase